GAVDELPHAAGDRSVAAHHMRKAAARVGAIVVNRTRRAVEEDASGLVGAAQDQALFRVLYGVFRQEARRGDPQMPGKVLDVALGEFHRRHTATIRADGAIDLFLDTFGDPAQNAVAVIARL